MTTLAARRVEHPRANRQAEDVEDAGYFPAVALETEEGFVLVEVAGVEKGRPPFAGSPRLRQKNTGSR